KKLKKSAVRRYEADAMVDTGAVRSVIPAHVMQVLGVMSRGNRVAEDGDGRTESVTVTEPIIFDVMERDTLEEALVLGDEVLIGQQEARSVGGLRQSAIDPESGPPGPTSDEGEVNHPNTAACSIRKIIQDSA